jgi:hypothetical protein
MSRFRLGVKGCNRRLPVPVAEELPSTVILSAVRVRLPFPEARLAFTTLMPVLLLSPVKLMSPFPELISPFTKMPLAEEPVP